ncbi:MAG: sensor domain-containing diguanylate cyclase [bacterium]|nr:sensor domain-containing diguanylate cyclase [bacterium]
MIPPKLPENEAQRLSALYDLNILDTEAEERFDRITRIAKQLFKVPIALISMVDANRQWFKSKQGLAGSETSRDVSFCGHVIIKDDMMIVEDASKDDRFYDNPLVLSAPNIRFYLGCPLKIKKEYNVGTLCLIDDKSRQFTVQEKAIMRDLADMVQAELEAIDLSTSDELTGLTNRRGFLLMGKHIFSFCDHTDTPMTLLFFDLNKFKQINDTFGHKAGDDVLKIFADALLKTFSNSLVTARLGGDEFCILIAEPSEDITKHLEQLNQALTMKKTSDHQVEFSVGAINYDKQRHHSLSDMLEEADQKMYANKRHQ